MSLAPEDARPRGGGGEGNGTSRDRAAWAKLWGWAPGIVVALFGLGLLWPVPLGRMPMSGDHPVHLSRAFMTAQHLAEGRFSGWSENWFLGFPLGELYPPGGDLVVIAVHTLGLGLLSWHAAYAIAFSGVFVVQGLVLVRLGRKMGFGVVTGVVAGILMLADPGFSREGGWMYTVWFGVWPQALATSLVWLGFCELAPSAGGTDGEKLTPRDRVLRAGFVLGAAIVSHPMALPMLVIGAPVYVLTVGPRRSLGDASSSTWRQGVTTSATEMTLAGLLALGVSAWWLLPMLAHRGYMSSYGWLYASLEHFGRWASEGHLTQRMPSAVGYSAMAGLLVAVLRGNGFARFVAAFAVLQWGLASSDAFWDLRLDRFSEGFTHIQYQRFLTAAKPGFYLLAGLGVGLLAKTAGEVYAKRALPRIGKSIRIAITVTCTLAAATQVLWLGFAHDTRYEEDPYGFRPGEVLVDRTPDPWRTRDFGEDPATFERDYQAFVHWAKARWDAGDRDYRFGFVDQRNAHWFMDFTVATGAPLYKAGFTPGDNFVHKPESSKAPVLDAARVRYLVRRSRGDRKRPGEVARFGSIQVVERDRPARPDAWLHGGHATVESTAGRASSGNLRVELGPLDQSDHLVMGFSAHPRWQVRVDGAPRPFVELPIWGEAAPLDPALRIEGQVRGGRADGDDGREPTLLAVPVVPGDRVVEFTYRQWQPFDVLAVLLSVCSWMVVVVGRFVRHSPMGRAVARLLDRATTSVLPAYTATAVGLALVLMMGLKWSTNARAATMSAVEQVSDAPHKRARPAPLKSGMLIRPAVLMSRTRPSWVRITTPRSAPAWSGWVGFDDDEAKNRPGGRVAFTVEARAAGSKGAWTELHSVDLRAAPRFEPFEIDASSMPRDALEIRIRTEPRGEHLPRLGFDLDWGGVRTFR